jgi:sulfite reductase (NADPH) flavoprotein alpha-component
MLKKILYQAHWLMGITAGIVLAVVGVTGAMLSFEDELLVIMNRGVVTVASSGAPALSPPELLRKIENDNAGKRVMAFTVWADPQRAARVTFAADKAAPAARGETQYADPRTGELLGEPPGASFFRQTRQVHRWLAAGDIGKHMVGASTVALILLCLSGLYLRWPRNALNWRAWLVFDVRRKGRGFLYGLHSVLGTWVLVPYLLMGLTGLYWSYDWYRDALFTVTGAPRPSSPAKGAEPARRRQAVEQATDVAAVWKAFAAQVGSFQSANFRLPERPGQPLQILYLDNAPPHDRAFNRLMLDPANGSVRQHERYADKKPGAKLMSSMFALHSGSFFGLAGVIALMLASMLMPVFALTGWLLYLERRGRKRSATVSRAGSATSNLVGDSRG